MADGGRTRTVEWCGRTFARRRFSLPTRSTTRSSTDMAIGGSTNAIIHLIAMAGRAGVPLTDRGLRSDLARGTPVIANLRPSGEYLMEDFYDAGGLPALLSRMRDHLALDCPPSTAARSARTSPGPRCCHDEVILPLDRAAGARRRDVRAARQPCARRLRDQADGGRAATAQAHRPGASSSRTTPDLKERIDDEDLDVTPDSVIVLQNAGPLGRAGHAGVGHAADPEEAAATGRARHGAHLRRPHERHELRHVRPARLARVGHRRPVRAGRATAT